MMLELNCLIVVIALVVLLLRLSHVLNIVTRLMPSGRAP
jgi:uncharacterized protein YoxC